MRLKLQMQQRGSKTGPPLTQRHSAKNTFKNIILMLMHPYVVQCQRAGLKNNYGILHLNIRACWIRLIQEYVMFQSSYDNCSPAAWLEAHLVFSILSQMQFRLAFMLELLQDRMPDTEILLLALTPRGDGFEMETAWVWPGIFTPAIEDINQWMEMQASIRPGVFYLDCGHYLLPDGKVRRQSPFPCLNTLRCWAEHRTSVWVLVCQQRSRANRSTGYEVHFQ